LYIILICLFVAAPTLHQHPPQDSTHLVTAPTSKQHLPSSTTHLVAAPTLQQHTANSTCHTPSNKTHLIAPITKKVTIFLLEMKLLVNY